MSNQMPIYSVVPKSQYRVKKGTTRDRPQNLARTDFDPLNYNHGGNFQHGVANIQHGGANLQLTPEARDKIEARMSQEKNESKRESRRTKEERRKTQNRNEASEGKVEAYLRQNQVSMRQQQHRHSAVRQAEHRVNLRSLPLNDVATSRPHDRTPTERHRDFPEKESDCREHRRDRERARDKEHNFEDFTPLSPITPRAIEQNYSRPVRKSSSAQRVTESNICADKRRFFCREWAFQKIAHCLEQRPVSKTCGALILGDAGSGKTAVCQELSDPSPGPQARQQRALNRKLLARHLLQSRTENSLRPAEFVRSLAMQILSHSSKRTKDGDRERSPKDDGMRRRSSEEDLPRFKHLDENEECSKPLLLDSSDQPTDEDEAYTRRPRTIDRIHERDAYTDSIGDTLPQVQPRTNMKPTNPFLTEESKDNPDGRLYENHENLFLRNISQRQSKELRSSRLVRQSSEPLNDKKPNLFSDCLNDKRPNAFSEPSSDKRSNSSSEPMHDKKPNLFQKSLSTDEERNKIENSPPKSRIPVANFKYPNKPELKLSSTENSPQKKLDFTSMSRAKTCENQDGRERKTSTENGDMNEENHNIFTDNHASLLTGVQHLMIDDMASEVMTENPHIMTENQPTTTENQLIMAENQLIVTENKPIMSENGAITTENDVIMTENEAIMTENQEESQIELPEYTNILKPDEKMEPPLLEVLLEKKRSQYDDVPPPIPSLPISPRTLIANAYYEKLLADPEIQQALLPQNLEKNPDECFKKALLFPLLEIDPPKQCLFLLVDGIDEGFTTVQADNEESSTTVATLLSRHQHLLPQWLLLVCTARKHAKSVIKMFTGFRKIVLDELARPHVSADVQRYVLARLDTEPRLRARVSSDSTAAAAAAAALDHLRIKSDGCLLYLEKVLDGVADGFIALREIKEIPGTLNGLYLWLAQRLFHGRRFTKVRLLLDVLLSARCGVTEEMLYKCLLTKECSVTREHFNRRLHLLRRILVMDTATGYLSMFHASFATWLLDVKHCTRRYLCSLADGHAALAMYYTLDATRLSAMEVHNYVYHMTALEQHLTAHKKKNSESQDSVLDLHTLILLWVLDSGCDIDAALKKDNDALKSLEAVIQKTEDKSEENGVFDVEDKEPDPQMLESILPALSDPMGRWEADRRVTQVLMELGPLRDEQRTSDPPEAEQAIDTSIEDQDTVVLDSSMVHELAAKGDEDTLTALLKRYPEASNAVDSTGSTPLHVAARFGRASCAAILLRSGAKADAADGDGWSALRAAAWPGHAEVVEVLLEYGCDVDCVDADNRTALRAAAWSGHTAVVNLLLSAGASASIADAEGRTALIAAAYMGHVDIVRALLDNDADLHHADEDGRTALSVASLCASGAACAALLIERGADVNRADRDGATPLLVAAFEGHTEICELLLEAEADMEAMDLSGRTALWAAAAAGHAAVARLLLFWGACVDTMDHEGRTVLSIAAAQGNVEVVRQLLDRGLDEHHRDNSGWTPLHYAAFEGHLEVCEALLEAGAKVDEADNDGKGALMLASQEGHTRLVELFVDTWGAPVDQRAHDGKTALRLAALEGHFDTVQCLYSRGADVNSLDADMRSTLYALALDNRLAMARYLIVECGANVDTTDNEGRTPLHVSAWQGHTDMVNLLIKVGGASVDGRDRCLRTALHAAAWRGRCAALRALLQHGACVTAVCAQGATPLGIAAQEGHEECVMWLLQHGADPMQADHCGRTPAAVAWRAGHVNICRLLERCKPSAPQIDEFTRGSPELKRRSVHSNSTKSSSNLTVTSSLRSHDHTEQPDLTHSHDKANRGNLSLSFAQQVARVGRGRREKERVDAIPENSVLERDSNLRSYTANERDSDLRGYACERDRRRDERHGYGAYERDNMSPLYASPPRSPSSDVCSPTHTGSQLHSLPSQPQSDTHFTRDTHMRIILGRESKQPNKQERFLTTSNSSPHQRPLCDLCGVSPSRGRQAYNRLMGSIGRARGRIFKRTKNKRNGIVTNPAMRLVANVRNGLDNAAANIRRTGVALAASAGSNNPAVKTNAFQWRKETPL